MFLLLETDKHFNNYTLLEYKGDHVVLNQHPLQKKKKEKNQKKLKKKHKNTKP